MSPPDLLSPPLSTTSHHSDSCHSPSSSLPLSSPSSSLSLSSPSSSLPLPSRSPSSSLPLPAPFPSAFLCSCTGEQQQQQQQQQQYLQHLSQQTIEESQQQPPTAPAGTIIQLCSGRKQENCSNNCPATSPNNSNLKFLLASYEEQNNNKSQAKPLAPGGEYSDSRESLTEEGKEGGVEEEGGGLHKASHASPLPSDIPTLESLSQTSPKLSTWRQTRIISEKLEQHLWTWRCACKKSGKRISKSLLQARAKWAFRKAGIAEFKASDGWYWKWLSKWRRKGQEIGITEQGALSTMEIQVLPQNSQLIKTEVKEESCLADSPCAGCPDCTEEAADPVPQNIRVKSEPVPDASSKRRATSPPHPPGHGPGPAAKLAKLEPRQEEERRWGQQWTVAPSQDVFSSPCCPEELDLGLSFVPLDALEPEQAPHQQLIPNRRIAVSDILPLNLTSGQVCLALDPTGSSLPISPIFIKTGGQERLRVADEELDPRPSSSSSVLEQGQGNILDNLEEITNLHTEFLSLESLCHWSGDIEDLDTDQLVSAFCSPDDQGAGIKKEQEPHTSREDLESPQNEDLEEEEDVEEDEDDDGTESSTLGEANSSIRAPSHCGLHHKQMPSPASIQDACSPGSSGKQQLTVIALHKKRGEESLNRFKEEVRKYAVDHTFKETAKKFGIHHSTVSGWVKESEKQDKCAHFGDFFREKGDDKFILWLRECRETGVQVNLGQVKSKVAEILASCGQQEVEKTCKWFLLWHNRREEKLYVEGMEDEDMKKETQNLAYPPAFKLEVALFAKKHSQYAAAKIFNVARRRIFDWMRQIPKLEELISKGHMKKMTGRGPKNRDIDQALYTWYCERKASGNRPKSCHVQSKARELYLTCGYHDMKCSYGWFKRWSQRFQIQLRYSYDDEIIEWIMARFDGNLAVSAQDLQHYGLSLIKKEDPSFKASSGWALRFCKRHKDFINCDSNFGSKLPPHLENRVSTFRAVLAQLHREKSFPAFQVGAMDELCLHFSLLPGQGEKRSCILRHPGMESSHCTVILSCTADGNLLPPFVIFKAGEEAQPSLSPGKEGEREGGRTKEEGEEGCRTTRSLLSLGMTSGMAGEGEAGSVGELEMAAWLQQVWFKHVPSPNFLLADSFHVHTAQTTQKLLLQRDSCLAIIPNACSAKLQPLHQAIKEKFKAGVEGKYLSWCGSQGGGGREGGVPGPEILLAWVDQTFHTLRQKKREIVESFRSTEIFCRDVDK